MQTRSCRIKTNVTAYIPPIDEIMQPLVMCCILYKTPLLKNMDYIGHTILPFWPTKSSKQGILTFLNFYKLVKIITG